jgi:hypothetical protein
MDIMLKVLNIFFVTLAISSFARANKFDKMEATFKNELQTELNQLSLYKNNSPSFKTQTNEFSSSDETDVELSRISVLFGAFTEIDFKVIELKIQPYVELRFDKK